jgi:uncharacterized membrane protein YphA (DoxX/SURF4 family)
MESLETPWSTRHKVAFRFAFCYLALYLFPLSKTLAGSFGSLWPNSALVQLYERLWHRIVPWVGAHLLQLRRPITIIGESGDSTYENVRVLSYALLAMLVTALWSGLDQRRSTYSRLDQWLRWYVRVVLACAMFLYGSYKIIPSQMPPPNLTTLIQPTGDLSPHHLLWSVMGASKSYEMFAGAVEMLGGALLLIPGTATLGALVSFGAMTNVFLLDLFYEVAVKLWAGHLMALALFLILPNLRRLANALVLNRPARPEPRRSLFRRARLDSAAWGLAWALAIAVLGTALTESNALIRRHVTMPETNPLYGIWRVDEFVMDGQERPPLLTDSLRWHRVIFDSEPFTTEEIVVTTEGMSGRLSPFVAAIDPRKGTLSWRTPRAGKLNGYTTWILSAWTSMNPAAADGTAELTYDRSQPDLMRLHGLLNGHELRATLKKANRQFELTTRKFSWINDEYDLFNDRVLR